MRQKVEVLENVVRIRLKLLEAELKYVSGNLGFLGAIVFHQCGGNKDI
jgi:hypothetical protein